MKKLSFNNNWFFNGKEITVPHDALIHGKRNESAACGSAGGFFIGENYTYEKTFNKPSEEHAILEFEGVYRNAKVYINDTLAGGAAYGYIPFFIELDKYLKDGENKIRVECECTQPDSRWYSGAGIFRPVNLYVGPKDSIEPESVKVSTVSYSPAVIRIKSKKTIKVDVDNIKGEGTDFELNIPNAKLWNEDSPYLYTLHATNGEDSEDIKFGIRKLEWSKDGLFINGKETLLRGGCIHHDNGIVGACAYSESEYRKIKKMKDAGFNAIRSAHNPTSKALIEACDSLGMYIMDETWDMWYKHKNKNDYASYWRDNYLNDIESLVSRDYNHPSVIMYSIGNEVSEPARQEGIKYTKEMVEYIHSLDDTRPVTGGFNLMIISNSSKGKDIYDENEGKKESGSEKSMSNMNSTLFNLITSMIGPGMNKAANSKKADEVTSPSLDSLDIAGYNYASGRYPIDGKLHPDRIIVGSETFPYTLSKNWEMVKKYPYLIGDFMWTSWDYLGEAGLGAWGYTSDAKGFNKPYPWLLADSGAFDILGNPNGELFWASAIWDKGSFMCVTPVNHDEKPAKAVWRGTNAIPSWSWLGCEGKKANVEIYTCGKNVELFLNNKLIGKAKVKENRAIFKVTYAPGTLEAVIRDASGREIARTSLTSAKNANVKVIPEKLVVKPEEIAYVQINISDENGIIESNNDSKINVSVKNGELLGFGSANPRTEERFDSGEYTSYYGQALAIIRTGKSGETIIKASSNGYLDSATIKIEK